LLYACGPSLEHFRVDPDRLAFDHVIVLDRVLELARGSISPSRPNSSSSMKWI
jgi:hypothetical protein